MSSLAPSLATPGMKAFNVVGGALRRFDLSKDLNSADEAEDGIPLGDFNVGNYYKVLVHLITMSQARFRFLYMLWHVKAFVTVYPSGTSTPGSQYTNRAVVGITLQCSYDPFGAAKSAHRHVSFRCGILASHKTAVRADCIGGKAKNATDALSDTVFVPLVGSPYADYANTSVMQNKEYQHIFVEILVMDYSTGNDHDVQSEYLEQQKILHENSQDYGNLTVVVNQPQNDVSSEPPRKRRRTSKSSQVRSQKLGEMKASSLILRSASDVFKAEITRIKAETDDDEEELRLTIEADSMEDVEDMLYYIITNDLKESAHPIALIALANHYNLSALFSACAMRIIGELNVDNFVESQLIFSKYEIRDGYDELVDFGKKNYGDIEQLTTFKQLSFDFRQAIKSSACTSSSTNTNTGF